MREVAKYPQLAQLAGTRLKGKRGRRYWRSLEELAGLPVFHAYLENEFPSAVRQGVGMNRREFITLMGASLALAGLAGCNYEPQEQIVPYVHQPEGLVLGIPLYFATAFPMRGYGHGIVARQNEGRPTKVEGSPNHPSTLGGSNVWMQASILGFYDPDRSKVPVTGGQATSWSGFLAEWDKLMAATGGAEGLRIRLLSGMVTSPSLGAQIAEFKKVFPQTIWHQYEPMGRDNVRAGAKLAFGRYVDPVYDFLKAERVLSLDANFLMDDPGSVRYAREFAQRRRLKFKEISAARARDTAPLPADVVPTAQTMNRMYIAESTFTMTGAVADHRLATGAARVGHLAAAFAAAIEGRQASGLSAEESRFVQAAAEDLRGHRGSSLVIAGELQPPEVHALAHVMNQTLGNVGSTVKYVESIEPEPTDQVQSLRDLIAAMGRNEVDVLVILDTNAAFTTPADLNFSEALRAFSQEKNPDGSYRHTAIHHGLYDDETAFLCRWNLPLTHAYEMWGDVRGHDGTVATIQPLIAPLYQGRSHVELLAMLRGQRDMSARELLKNYWSQWWRQRDAAADTESLWTSALRDGVIDGTAAAVATVQTGVMAEQLAARLAPAQAPGTLEVNFRPDPLIWDGQFVNNGWLQETPKPINRLMWDNVALVSPATALKLGIPALNEPPRPEGKILRIANGERTMEIPAWVMLGQPEDTITVFLGYGRSRAGVVGTGIGFNPYPVRTTVGLGAFTPSAVTPTGKVWPLACAQHHQVMYGRDIVREREIADFTAAAPEPALDLQSNTTEDGKLVHLSLYDEYKYTGYKWGMVVDQSACIGCNACVVSCVSENNSPVVGKTECIRGREMHWLRIDTYYAGEGDIIWDKPLPEAHVSFQPMLCQHCEKAPCELVCPVEATTHSTEGINEMTYNRCVGTRYCSNNCPYKVRRFNFFNFNNYTTETYKLMRNPEVTVRGRGVMEKCTYCVQRVDRARVKVQEARLATEAQGLKVQMRTPQSDGYSKPDPLPPIEVLTACQQACPTEAIIFGDMNDADAFVSKLKMRQPYERINYGVLAELTTQPRTSYLERLLNPNPALANKPTGQS